MANVIGYGDQMVKLEAYGDQLVGPVPLSSSSGDLESIYNALVAKGITPASESLSDILAAINTIVVPSGTYTYPSGSTGGNVDVTNYAQVNAANVYAKGKADGGSGKVTPSYAYIADTAGQYNAWRYDNLYTFSAEVGAVYAIAFGGTGSNSTSLTGSGFTQLGWYRNANAGIGVFKATSGTVSVGRNGDWPYNNNGCVLVKITNAS